MEDAAPSRPSPESVIIRGFVGMFSVVAAVFVLTGRFFGVLLGLMIVASIAIRRGFGLRPMREAEIESDMAAAETAAPSTETPRYPLREERGQTGSLAMNYPFSAGSIFRRAFVMVLSAGACYVVAYFIHKLIWIGAMPDLGLQLPWKGEMKAIQPALYPLLILAVWLWLERASAHANPGYGYLWFLDFLPSLALFGFLALTGLKLIVAEIAFSDPTHLWIYVAFLGSAIGVAYFNFRHWIPGADAAGEEGSRSSAQGAGNVQVHVSAPLDAQIEGYATFPIKKGFNVQPVYTPHRVAVVANAA